MKKDKVLDKFLQEVEFNIEGIYVLVKEGEEYLRGKIDNREQLIQLIHGTDRKFDLSKIIHFALKDLKSSQEIYLDLFIQGFGLFSLGDVYYINLFDLVRFESHKNKTTYKNLSDTKLKNLINKKLKEDLNDLIFKQFEFTGINTI